MGELTDDAKKALSDAVAIVREDRFEKFAREHIGKLGNKAGGPTPPPPDPKDPSADPPTDPSTDHSRSRYWGELLKD